jgi:hypothetical protein
MSELPDYWHPTPGARLETDEEYAERRRREEKEFWARFERLAAFLRDRNE